MACWLIIDELCRRILCFTYPQYGLWGFSFWQYYQASNNSMTAMGWRRSFYWMFLFLMYSYFLTGQPFRSPDHPQRKNFSTMEKSSTDCLKKTNPNPLVNPTNFLPLVILAPVLFLLHPDILPPNCQNHPNHMNRQIRLNLLSRPNPSHRWITP